MYFLSLNNLNDNFLSFFQLSIFHLEERAVLISELNRTMKMQPYENRFGWVNRENVHCIKDETSEKESEGMVL